MPSIPIHPPSPRGSATTTNPLPGLLQTPSGLAIVELQGTIHFPSSPPEEPDAKRQRRCLDQSTASSGAQSAMQVGRVVFPLLNDPKADADGKGDDGWMKRVYLYVGSHQRMTGEVKKLSKPVAVVRRRRERGSRDDKGREGKEGEEGEEEELEIVEVVKYKIVFATRPEPVGAMDAGG